jgi:hypothetical protein
MRKGKLAEGEHNAAAGTAIPDFMAAVLRWLTSVFPALSTAKANERKQDRLRGGGHEREGRTEEFSTAPRNKQDKIWQHIRGKL